MMLDDDLNFPWFSDLRKYNDVTITSQ